MLIRACFSLQGIMVGTSSFGMLAAGQLIATAALLASLQLAPATLIGVWGSFYVFNGVRLANVLRYQFFTGPLRRKKE